jgi:hypothetical protein
MPSTEIDETHAIPTIGEIPGEMEVCPSGDIDRNFLVSAIEMGISYLTTRMRAVKAR